MKSIKILPLLTLCICGISAAATPTDKQDADKKKASTAQKA